MARGRNSGSAGLAHRRLAIIDLSEGGRQPMAPGPTAITYQRRNLQLPRTAPGTGRPLAVPLEFRHRDDPRRLRAVRHRLPRPSARHVRVRAVGRAGAAAVLRARPLRHQAALLRGRRQSVCLCLRGEGAAAVPARHRDRYRRLRRIPDVPVHDRRNDAVPRHQAVDARARAEPSKTAASASGAIGMCATRSISSTTNAISSAASSTCSTIRSMCICAATCRSAPMSRAASIPA